MKHLFTLLSIFCCIAITFAQAPEKMTFQAVVRDATNNLLNNQNVGMQISILQGSSSGNALYVESHTSTTNENGLVTIEIGAGNVSEGDFGTIDWTNGPFYIKSETDPSGGVSYSITGTSQLMSVPFALYAKTAASVTEQVYSIGHWPELGGFVFQISSDGKHGLVAELQDQGVVSWYGAQDFISNPDNHSADGSKFFDWRLPTKHELNEMYTFSAPIGSIGTSFGTNTYWSSTLSFANDGESAWRQNFDTGAQYNSSLFTLTAFFFVRAVREF
jgi:hypothetical protein